jgi:uncharacterized protein YfcZ (UPF0381/DUF406 family)
MDTKAFVIDAEWDLSHTNLVFSTQFKARQWLNNSRDVADICASDDCTVSDLFNEGLLRIREVTYV